MDAHTLFKGTLVVLTVLGIITQVSQVGKPRQPLSAGVAATSVLLNGLIVAGIIAWL